jgi:hypothetical protein
MAFTATTASWGNEFRSPRAAALGGAGHANPLLNDSVFQNPSFASFLPVYSWSGNFKALGEDRGRAYSISVLDGRSELFQASAAYTVRDELTALHLGASRKLNPKMTVGVGAKFFYSKNKDQFQNTRNLNLSVTSAPLDWLQLALIGENLVTSSDSSQLGLEREVILGTKFKVTEKVLLYIDPRARLGKGLELPQNPVVAYEAGGELQVLKDFYFRAGTFKNIMHPDVREKSRGFGYGVGWVAPRMSFDFAIEHILVPQDRVSMNSGVTLYF